MTFEESEKRLEEIVKQLENNNFSVEEGVKLYEEGVKLAQNCYNILNEAKGKVTILKEELDNLKDDDLTDF